MPPKTLVKVGVVAILLALAVSSMTMYWLMRGSWADLDAYLTAFLLVFITCVFTALAGIGAILRGIVVWLRGVLGGSRALRIFPEMALQNVISLQRHRPMPLTRDLPNFGTVLICLISLLSILVFIFMILTPRTPTGLPVDFREQIAVGVEKSPWTETVSVYVDIRRGFLVNGQPVPRAELGAKLKKELGKQMVWTVYLEADRDCLFMDAAYAIDTIQGLGAKLIWITPRSREEWKRKTAPQNASPAPYS